MNLKANYDNPFCPRCGQLLYKDYGGDLACCFCGYRAYPWPWSEDEITSPPHNIEKFRQTILTSQKWKEAKAKQRKVPTAEYQVIIDRRVAGESLKTLARDYNVAESTIIQIAKKNPSWKDGRFKLNNNLKRY